MSRFLVPTFFLVLGLNLQAEPIIGEEVVGFQALIGNPTSAPLTRATDGWLYGFVAPVDPTDGGIYRVRGDATEFKARVHFSAPKGRLVDDGQGNLWGHTKDPSVIFRYALATGTVTPVATFGTSSLRGTNFVSTLTPDTHGYYWGTTYAGGIGGTIYRVHRQTGTATTVAEFSGTSGNLPGARPSGDLTPDDAGNLWGATAGGGKNGLGTIFKINTATGVPTTVAHFPAGGVAGRGPVFPDSMGRIWGTIQPSTSSVYRVDPVTGVFTTVVSWQGQNYGPSPYLYDDGAGNFWGTTDTGGSVFAGTVFRVHQQTGALTIVGEFSKNGFSTAVPDGRLQPDGQGWLWGRTKGATSNGPGYFKVNLTTGQLVATKAFPLGEFADQPLCDLVLADGAMWGTAGFISSSRPGGAVYRVPVGGTVPVPIARITTGAVSPASETLVVGCAPSGDLVRAADGRLWGVTSSGGIYSCGTIFFLEPATGVLTTVLNFTGRSGTRKGSLPSGLLLAPDGALWGTTWRGGTTDAGTVFRYQPANGSFATVADFNRSTEPYLGESPDARLVLDGAGNIWGTTIYSGAFAGTGSYPSGTIFRVNRATETFTSVATFDLSQAPYLELPQNLVWDGVGHLWGVCRNSDLERKGAIFKVNPATSQVELVGKFGSGPGLFEGSLPIGLVPDGQGFLWGATVQGGARNRGHIFKIQIATGEYRVMADVGESGLPYGLQSFFPAGNGDFWGSPYDSVYPLLRFDPRTNAVDVPAVFTPAGAAFSLTLPSAPVKGLDGHLYGTSTSSNVKKSGGFIYRLRTAPRPARFDEWAAANVLTGVEAEAGADPDRDGVTNAFEFFHGLNPRAGARPRGVLPELSEGFVSGLGKTLRYTHRRSASASASATYETTDTLTPGNWVRTAPVALVILSTDPVTGDQIVQADFEVGPGGKRFVRMKLGL